MFYVPVGIKATKKKKKLSQLCDILGNGTDFYNRIRTAYLDIL